MVQELNSVVLSEDAIHFQNIDLFLAKEMGQLGTILGPFFH